MAAGESGGGIVFVVVVAVVVAGSGPEMAGSFRARHK